MSKGQAQIALLILAGIALVGSVVLWALGTAQVEAWVLFSVAQLGNIAFWVQVFRER